MALRLDIAACFAFALLASATRARADDAIALRLRYAAPQTCPNAGAFLAQVIARTPLARPARHDEPATALSVVVTQVPGGSAGTLELVGPDATTSVRRVSAADCEQLVSALALMTALAIDPNASTAPAPPATRSPAAPPARTKPASDLGPSRARWIFEVGLLLEALGGVAPDPVLLARPFVELARQGGSAWSYGLRLSGARAHADVRNSEGAGDLTLWAARIEPCPILVSFARGFGLAACLPLEVGRLEAVGSGVTPTRRIARPWLSMGSTGRVQWQVVDMLVLEAAGELFFPIVRDRFFVGSSATLHRAPAVAGGGSVGIGVRFP